MLALLKDPLEYAVVVLGGPGFDCLDMLYVDRTLRHLLAVRFPAVDFVYPGSLFDKFTPPHLWSPAERDQTPLQVLHLHWAQKAWYNEKVLQLALHAPLPADKKIRVACVLRYGFCARTSATAFCDDPEMVELVEKIHTDTVAVSLPKWRLPVPFYIIPRADPGDEVALRKLLSPQFNSDPEAVSEYIAHYMRTVGTYFVHPQRPALKINPTFSLDEMRTFIVDSVAEQIVEPRLLALAA